MTLIQDSLTVEGQIESTTQGVLLGTFEEMPEPGEDKKGVVVYYVGQTGTYRSQSFYMCITEDDGASYIWHPLVLALDDTKRKADNAVPQGRTINGKSLVGDIILTAEDVGALPSTTKIPTKVTDLSNDGVYITQDVSTLSNYWTKPQMKRVLEPYCRILIVDKFPEDEAIDPHALYSVPQNGSRKLFYRVDGAWVQVA